MHGSSTIEGNRISENGGMGIWVFAESSQIRNNEITGNGIHGIEFNQEVESIFIEGNEITGNNIDGIVAGSEAVIKNNIIDGNLGSGIILFETAREVEISGHNTISNNQAYEIILTPGSSALIRENSIENDSVDFDNGDRFAGIQIEGSARVERNLIRKMKGAAIFIHETATDVVITDMNNLENNIHGIVAGAPATIKNNTISNSLETGVYIVRPAKDVILTWNRIEKCVYGIFCQRDVPGVILENNNITENTQGVVVASNTRIRGNTVQNNSSCGIWILVTASDLGNKVEADSGKNAILQNGEWNLKNESADSISAWYNYWGINDTESIDSTIWDDDEDSLAGPVIFEPFLSDLNVGIGRSFDPVAGDRNIHHLNVFPNPFSQHVTVRFTLKRPGMVHLRIFDPSGRIIKSMRAGPLPETGKHQLQWDGSTMSGGMARPGPYFLVVEAMGEVAVREIIYLR
jgi:parallel beta-helix repeat protein